MVGTTVGRYEILSELGRGAFGVVWKARHTLLPDRVVALKVLSENLCDSQQARDRFLKEAIAVSRLEHSGIAALYDAEEIEGRLYIAFKFIDGETVRTLTSGGPLPPRRAMAVTRDAAEALAHAHAHGIIHRDVSPGNLMVDREGRGVLVDFGLAHTGDSLATATAGIIGTRAYAAPEVLREESADARSDIYSLGAVMYRMLTGRGPHEDRPFATHAAHRPAEPSALVPAVPPELDFIAMKALETNRSDRFASAGEIAGALNELLARPHFGEAGTAARSTLDRWFASARRKMWRRSSRWLTISAALGIVAIVAFGVAWLRGWRPVLPMPGPVVAVLPAQNVNQEPRNAAYIDAALGDEMVTRLGQVANLRLVAWRTTRRLTDPDLELKTIGATLKADRIVLPSYRSDGNHVWVNLALVDAHSGYQIWSRPYHGGIDELPTLQKDMAMGIAAQLRALTPEDLELLRADALPGREAYLSEATGGRISHRDY